MKLKEQLTIGALIVAIVAGFLWTIGEKVADRVWPDKI